MLAVVKTLEHWRPYLIWTEEPFIIETDHENLTYWKSPKKLTGRTARWHEKLQDYNFKIVHIQGKSNGAADALSRPPEQDIQKGQKEIVMLDPQSFVRIAEIGDEDRLETQILKSQQSAKRTLQRLAQ